MSSCYNSTVLKNLLRVTAYCEDFAQKVAELLTPRPGTPDSVNLCVIVLWQCLCRKHIIYIYIACDRFSYCFVVVCVVTDILVVSLYLAFADSETYRHERTFPPTARVSLQVCLCASVSLKRAEVEVV